MTLCPIPGWGSGGFGFTPWGGSSYADFRLIAAQAIRDNVIRVQFSQPPSLTGILDPKDGSNPARYSIVADTATTGYDGLPCRPVRIVLVTAASVPGSGGVFVDLTLDRPMSPYACFYLIAANNLYSATTGLPLNPCFAQFRVPALYRFLAPQVEDQAIPTRDIAHPDTLSALRGASGTINENELGIIPIDDSGDYAYDQGIINFKKRVYRRLVTRKNAFTFLPGYGVGVPQQLKRANTVAVRTEIVTEAQKQLSQEPEAEKVRVTMVTDPQNPSLVRLMVAIKMKSTGQGIQFGFPFLVSALVNPG